MPESNEKNQNTLALVLVLLSKAVGIGGLVVGFFNRTGGGALLVLDGFLIAAAVTICLRVGRQQSKAADGDREIVARLVREGTLKQYIKDVEAEARQASTPLLGAEAAAE